MFRTDRSVLEATLPPVLKPRGSRDLAIFRVGHPLASQFGPYTGSYLIVPALLGDRPVNHMVTGMKSSFSGTVAGREVWGMPLQCGEVTMGWSGDALRIDCALNGVDLAHVVARLERRVDPPKPGWTPPIGTYAVRRQRIDGDTTEMVLVSLEGAGSKSELSATEFWEGSATLKLVGGVPGDDWSIFPVHEVLSMKYSYSATEHVVLKRGEILAQW